jgi:membrane-associated phospholipid phosphatase
MIRSAEVVAFAYFVYLAAASSARTKARARVGSVTVLAGFVACELVLVQFSDHAFVERLRDAWPLLLLLAGYRLAGLFYSRPQLALEQWLLGVDRRLGLDAPEARPSRGGADITSAEPGERVWARVTRAVAAGFETAYLGVYVILPLGALTIALAGGAGSLDRYWATVLLSGFVCYGALPWIQTRPPRVVCAPRAAADASAVRRLNLAILERGSVGANTLPSGHAATAVAAALAVAAQAPTIGAFFAAVAGLIVIATVTGRYHYAVDSLLGVVVGVAAWRLLG